MTDDQSVMTTSPDRPSTDVNCIAKMTLMNNMQVSAVSY